MGALLVSQVYVQSFVENVLPIFLNSHQINSESDIPVKIFTEGSFLWRFFLTVVGVVI